MNKLITALALALALAGCGSDPINREQGDPRQAAQGWNSTGWWRA